MPGRGRRRANRDQELEDLGTSIAQGATLLQNSTPQRSTEFNTQSTMGPDTGSSGGPGQTGLEDLLARLLVKPNRKEFKPPRFNGETDVELFISMFLDVSQANQWEGTETALHLRGCLEGPAAESGRASTLPEILESLRSRYGLTARQARDKLDRVKKTPKQTLYDYGSEITKLTSIAYAAQDEDFQRQACLEKFQKGLGHSRLQQHLLTVPYQNMTEAVRIAEEFMQYEGGDKSHIQVIDCENPESKPVHTTPTEDKLDKVLKALEGLITSQAAFLSAQTMVRNPAQMPMPLTRPPVFPRGPCYQCGGPHLKRECRTTGHPAPNPAPRPAQPAENRSHPAQ